MGHNKATIAITAAVVGLSLIFSTIGTLRPLMAILGVALVVAPAYTWSQVLLRSRIAGLVRLIVIAGLAFLIPILGGLALYASGILLNHMAWVSLLAGVTIAGDAVLLFRGFSENPRTPRSRQNLGRVPARQAIVFGAAVLIAAGAVGLARAGVATQSSPGFTGLWLSPLSKQPSLAVLGVSNHQGDVTHYRLVLFRNGRTNASWDLTLANGQTWQRKIKLANKPNFAADLYRVPDLEHPFRQVSLYSNVSP